MTHLPSERDATTAGSIPLAASQQFTDDPNACRQSILLGRLYGTYCLRPGGHAVVQSDARMLIWQ